MSRPIRRLLAEDVDAAARLSAIAGWNQTHADWSRVLALEPEGCFCIGEPGAVVATATVVCFAELAWIGMVLTDPEHRGRGYARALMERCIAFGRARDVAWMKLDATPMGYALYRDLGFADECPIERWGREAALEVIVSSCDEYSADPALDLAAFGADRSRMIGMLAGEAASVRGEGFAMARDGARAAYFGPCVARTEATARRLLEWFLGRRGGELAYWDILPSSKAAVELARGAGFSPLRQLVRMALPLRTPPPAFAGDNSLIYATAGFEYG